MLCLDYRYRIECICVAANGVIHFSVCDPFAITHFFIEAVTVGRYYEEKIIFTSIFSSIYNFIFTTTFFICVRKWTICFRLEILEPSRLRV